MPPEECPINKFPRHCPRPLARCTIPPMKFDKPMRFIRRILPVRAALAAGLGACLFCGGCVEQTLTIVTSPSDSLVYLNDVQRGRSPCTVPFEFYGTYDIRLRAKKNIGTPTDPHIVYYYLHTHKTTVRPWYQWYGIDLFAALLPIHLKDHQIWAFDLKQVSEPSTGELIKRADKLKAQLQSPPQQ